MKKLISFLLAIVFIFSFTTLSAFQIDVDKNPLLVSGKAVGLELNLGLKIVGTYAIKEENKLVKPWEKSGIREKDIILKYNNREVNTLKELQTQILKESDNESSITFLRDKEILSGKIKPAKKEDGSYSLGLYIKDRILGVGTLTYVLKDNNSFGSLGHNIKIEGDLKNGYLKEAEVYDIVKGQNGIVGQKNAKILNEVLGDILKNTSSGIHGTFKDVNEKDFKEMYIGKKEDVKVGKATILTCIDKQKIEEFDIEIIDVYKQNVKDIKSMKIKVTDPRLLEKTGGIVQGMSGSPIIQDNKIVGAVTHVIVNNPKEGYGIYIEWMLNDMDIFIKQ